MPTEAADNLPMFTECLGVISAVIASHDDVESVICLGDFNGDVSHKNSLFGRELVAYCEEEDWTCADVSTLGVTSGTYTYLSDAHGTTSWIDHVVVTSAALRALRGVRVLNNVYWSDHFPLAVEFDFDLAILTPISPHLRWPIGPIKERSKEEGNNLNNHEAAPLQRNNFVNK
ncbi:unnamed protein product [Leptidea sinapis]|uniref:Endonuclease/exonuclease/phosphatase domain-containing protein n=1 Tax=Leptidea sinapis TaxID=189913 RepID=A0A5E4QWV3_9NEOP|nr:unnamed protein product [Leptidea sinapis]